MSVAITSRSARAVTAPRVFFSTPWGHRFPLYRFPRILMLKRGLPVLAAVAAVSAASWTSAAVVYSDGFDTAAVSSNYNVFITQGSTGNSGDATFGYNYGAAPASGGLSIPVAPHTTDATTTGLRLRTDNLQNSVGSVVGATTVITKGLTLPSAYTVQVDVWSNYIGGTNISASGSNGTTGVTV